MAKKKKRNNNKILLEQGEMGDRYFQEGVKRKKKKGNASNFGLPHHPAHNSGIM